MIKNIKIKELYNLYSYDIDCINKDNILIITGPNGFGKTTILQIINHLCSLNLWYFYFIPFKEIEILFADRIRFVITKINEVNSELGGQSVTINMYDEDGQVVSSFDVDDLYIRHLCRIFLPYSILRNESNIKLDEYLEKRYQHKNDERLISTVLTVVEYFMNQKCLIIEEQRLLSDNHDKNHTYSVKTVEEIQQNINQFFAEAQKTYSSNSLRIDSTFIQRLAAKNIPKSIMGRKGDEIYRKVVSKINDFKKYGLVKELEVVSELGVHYKEVLNLYFSDLLTKLSFIDSYYKKLSTFDNMVSYKQLSYKRLKFEDDRLSIVSANGDEIPVYKLSSGEQNLLVLCYKLIFELNDRNILLIDEPEKSLHVAWLDNLLEDYINIAKLSNCQIIIATHSPAFIHGRWDLTCDLCENANIQEFTRDC